MTFTVGVLPSFLAIIIIIIILVASSLCEVRCPNSKLSGCLCYYTSCGYELQCSQFTVQVEHWSVIRVLCTADDITYTSVLNNIEALEVDTLIIWLCPLPSVPLSQVVQNLTVSNISNVQITYTSADQRLNAELLDGLSSVTNLTLLDLTGNSTVLPNDIFSSVPKLEELVLGSSDVMYLEPHVFRNLSHLRLLNTFGNMQNICSVVFSGVHNLESLNMESNKITDMQSDCFKGFIKLRKMNFYRNEFQKLPQNLFVNNQSLERDNFQDNRQKVKTLPSRLFANLTELKVVEVNSCNMSTVYEDMLWGLTAVKTVSLSNNTLTTLPALLFKDCAELQSLDLSFNQIADLPDLLFSNTKNLRILKLNNNQLTVITNHLFSSLIKLEFLDLKDNRLMDISTSAFMELHSLKAVNMTNNMLTFENRGSSKKLSPLYNCHKLEDVQLANNSLIKIFADWRYFEFLETLNLAYNKLSKIQAIDLHFSSKRNSFVNISNNNISEIDIFDAEGIYKNVLEINNFNENGSIPNKYFYIKGNPIECDCETHKLLHYDKDVITAEVKFIMETKPGGLQCVEYFFDQTLGQLVWHSPINLFTCLLKKEYRLNYANEYGNLIFKSSDKSLSVDGHYNLTRAFFYLVQNLELLDISSNKMISLPKDLFVDLRKLRKIILHTNEFRCVPQNMFLNNVNLETFTLQDNKQTLKVLPPRLLANLTKLKEVKINSCNMSIVHEDLLWGSTAINTISLNNNALTTVPELLFKDCNQLEILDLGFNNITNLPAGLLTNTTSLRILKINNNQLTVITNYSFSSLKKLEVLDLKNNRLKNIYPKAFVNLFSLKAMNMSNNMLAFEDSFKYKMMNLSLKHHPLYFNDKLEDIQLANNLLTEILSPWRQLRFLEILNLTNNKISQLQAEDLNFISIKNTFVDLSYNCISEIDVFDYETIYEYTLETKNIQGPIRRFIIANNSITFDCKVYSLLLFGGHKIAAEVRLTWETSNGDRQINRYIPVTFFTCLLKREYSPNCPEECNCLFRPLDKALVVDCHNRSLNSVPKGLPDMSIFNYTELILSENNIQAVKPLSGTGYCKVIKYILSDNIISEIDLATFSKKLQVLELERNNITNFNKSSVDFLITATRLNKLTLHQNPWRCDCTNKKLVSVIQSNNHLKEIKELNKTTCGNESGKALFTMSDTEVCPVESETVYDLSFIFVVLGLLSAIFGFYYKFKKAIKVWLYAHQCCLWFVTEEELDKDKVYDAFISYSHHDEDFVNEFLVEGLENGPIKFKLCLHYRHWIGGEYIPSQIVKSVDESRRTIVVLSSKFLQSVWGRMEFRAAHQQALNEKRTRVIIIMYGELGPTDKIDSELRAYLTMNTYIRWDDPFFWDKLIYALPHPLKSQKRIPLQERCRSNHHLSDQSVLKGKSQRHCRRCLEFEMDA